MKRKKDSNDKKTNKKKYISAFLVFVTCFAVAYWATTEVSQVFDGIATKTTITISLCIAGLFSLLVLLPKKKREFKNIEHGSAEWGDFKSIKKLSDSAPDNNILFSENVKVSCNTRKTGLNNHTLVIGGSGAGKSYYFVTPNLMQMNQSYIVTDPKGEHFAGKAKMLMDNGYDVKVFNLIDFEKSMHFNPLVYFSEISDIKRFVTMFIQNTTGDTTHPQNNDDFWTKAEKLWLMATLSYIDECCLPEEKTLNSVMKLLDSSQAKDEDEDFMSAVDILFSELEKSNPDSFAAKQYKKYKLAAGKTAKSILVSLGVRLTDFDIPKIRDLVNDDELELDKIGDRKTAFFIILDDTDTAYNYIAAILLDVLFNVLKRKADASVGQKLKIPVTCLLDEFANIGRFQNFHILISVLRSRGIALIIILQSLAQLKASYKDTWEIIEGNCDITLFLGGKGDCTQKYVSDVMVGKATIDTVSTGGSGGSMTLGYNNFNMNEQKAGRNLIDENEVARLDGTQCIVNIRGYQPFKDNKLRPNQHKNYKLLQNDVEDAIEQAYSSILKSTDLGTVKIKYITEIDLEEVA